MEWKNTKISFCLIRKNNDFIILIYPTYSDYEHTEIKKKYISILEKEEEEREEIFKRQLLTDYENYLEYQDGE